jgi:hypothetical protein
LRRMGPRAVSAKVVFVFSFGAKPTPSEAGQIGLLCFFRRLVLAPETDSLFGTVATIPNPGIRPVCHAFVARTCVFGA